MSSFSVGKRLVFTSSLILGISFVVTALIFYLVVENYAAFIVKTTEDALTERCKETLKTSTEIAVSMVASIFDSGEYTLEEKLDLSKKLLRSLRFGENGFFFAYETGTGVNLIHGSDRTLEGRNLWDTVSPDGKRYIIRELDAVAGKKTVFLEYPWTKPGKEGLYRKLDTAMLVPGTRMWIGTGAYLDDATVDAERLHKNIATITGMVEREYSWPFVVIFVLGLSASLLVAGSISRPLKSLIRASEKIASGDFDVEIKVKTGGEIGILAAAFGNMAKTIRNYTDNLENMVKDRTADIGRLSDESGRKARFEESLSSVSRAMAGAGSLDGLLDGALNGIVDFLDVPMAAIYVNMCGEKSPVFERKVSFGYPPVSEVPASFTLNEGLVGRAASGGRSSVYTLSQGEIGVCCGIGIIPLKFVMHVPLLFKRSVIGVVEIAGTKEPAAEEIAWLEKAGAVIAISIVSQSQYREC